MSQTPPPSPDIAHYEWLNWIHWLRSPEGLGLSSATELQRAFWAKEQELRAKFAADPE